MKEVEQMLNVASYNQTNKEKETTCLLEQRDRWVGNAGRKVTYLGRIPVPMGVDIDFDNDDSDDFKDLPELEDVPEVEIESYEDEKVGNNLPDFDDDDYDDFKDLPELEDESPGIKVQVSKPRPLGIEMYSCTKPRPPGIEIYFEECIAVDMHNRLRPPYEETVCPKDFYKECTERNKKRKA